jgi:hypothetical protein
VHFDEFVVDMIDKSKIDNLIFIFLRLPWKVLKSVKYCCDIEKEKSFDFVSGILLSEKHIRSSTRVMSHIPKFGDARISHAGDVVALS